MACQQASGQDISDDIDDSDNFYLSGIQMEVDGDEKMTGRPTRDGLDILHDIKATNNSMCVMPGKVNAA